jgi:hypothetical protein
MDMSEPTAAAWEKIQRAVTFYRPDLDADLALVAQALAEARRQAIEQCARMVEGSSMNLLVEWGVTGLVVERQRNDLAAKLRALLPAATPEGRDE